MSGSSAYRAEDGREDDRGRDRSPLRSSQDKRETTGYPHADTKKQKLAFGFGKKSTTESKKGIQIKLGSTSVRHKKVLPKIFYVQNNENLLISGILLLKKPNARPAPTFQKPTVANVFNADDDDDEPEEMPAEARMRMRNIGRETPTSAGPNSFGKTKQGFCDSKKIFEKTLKKAMEDANK